MRSIPVYFFIISTIVFFSACAISPPMAKGPVSPDEKSAQKTSLMRADAERALDAVQKKEREEEETQLRESIPEEEILERENKSR